MHLVTKGMGFAGKSLLLLTTLVAMTHAATGNGSPIAGPSTVQPRAADSDPAPGEAPVTANPSRGPIRGRFDRPSGEGPEAPHTVAATTSLTMDSEPGDYIGAGQHQFYTTADGSFTMSGNRTYVGISFSSSGHSWHLDFSSPNSTPLAPGSYTGATRYPFNATGEPGLSVYGDGRGCNTLTGSFQIKQITFNAQNAVTSFWAKFEQHCEGGRAALTGDIRYNANVLLEVTAPSSRSVLYDQDLDFTVTAVSADSSHVTLTATGLPAGASFQDNGGNSGRFTWRPSFDQIGLHAAVAFHGDNRHGGIDSASTQISVNGQTALSMSSDPGDYIGGGQQYAFTSDDGGFSSSGSSRNHVAIYFYANSHNWYLDFSAPNNAQLAPGLYTGATRYPFNASNTPGLSVSGDGRGCNSVTGSFQIKQITFDAQNNLATFWAKFEQHCEGGTAALTGDIRYNAKIAVEVNSPTTASVTFNHPLQFAVSASAHDGSRVTLSAAGLPGGASFRDNGNSTGSFAWTPTFDQVGLRAPVVFRGDDGHGGVDSSVTQVAARGTTSLTLNSDPGDYVGGGQAYFFTPDDGSFRTSGTRNHVTLNFSSGSGSHTWALDFTAPGSASLAVGNYPNATQYAGSSTPGLDVTADYRGCSTITGSFQIKQITFDAQNNLASFWAKFEQHCEGGTAALTGDIRYNAKIAVEVNSPATVSVTFNHPLQFTVNASAYDSSHVTLTATGLPGGASFQDDGNNSGRFVWTPTFDQIGMSATVVFRGDNGRGSVDSSVTRVSATGLTSLKLNSDPGDYVGGGQAYLFTPNDGSFRLSGTRNHVTLTFSSGSHSWTLDFTAPGSASLAVGNYPNAARYAGASTPGLGVVGDYRSCSTVTGSFQIKQIAFDSGNNPIALRLTFEQHCEGAAAALTGEVRYNATVPVDIAAPLRRALAEGESVHFSVAASSFDGSHVTLTATGVPPGARFTDNVDNTASFDWTPAVHQQGAYRITFRGDNGHGGVDSASTTITVTGATSLYVVSEPRDSLGYVSETFLTLSDGLFSAQINYHGGVSVSVRDSSYRYWEMDFAAPNDARLRRDIYQGAGLYPNEAPNQAGLQVPGGCYSGTGSFVVKQVEYGAGNSVLSFWATFELRCDYGPNFHGEVRYNADIPLILSVPRTATVNEDQALTFDVRALPAPGVGISLSSASLPRGATFVDHADNTGTFAWRPDFDQDGLYRISFDGDDRAGLVDSTWSQVTVLNVNRSPVAKAGGPYVATAGAPVVFNGSGSFDPDGNNLHYFWSFGDGATGTGAQPAHAYGSLGACAVALTVTDGLLVAQDTTHVTVGSGPALPAILSFSPTVGPVGTRVTITGRNFVNVAAVTFGNRGSVFTVGSAEQITATVPAGAASGPIAVRTTLGTATSGDSFTVAPALAAACPKDPEYWASHVPQWPVESLLLGLVRYERPQLLAFLRGGSGDDDDEDRAESIQLAHQLVAAKLNLLSLPDGSAGAGPVALADSIIGSRLIPFETKEGCGEGKRLRRLTGTLEDYNDGELSPACHESGAIAASAEVHVEEAAAPRLSLAQNAPNPFWISTQIEFSLPRTQGMRLSVFDLLGREVSVLMDGKIPAGRHTATWSGTDASGRPVDSGVYFYRLSTDGSRLVRKLVLTRR